MNVLHHLLHAFCRAWPFERGRDFIMRHTFAGSFGDYLAACGPWIRVREGWRMRANMGKDYSSRILKLYGELEPTTGAFLLAHMPPDGVFLDIGANAGFFSLLLAKHFPKGRVIAFEPNPPIADLLAESIMENDLADRIELHRLAVSDQNAVLQFLVEESNSGHSRLAGGVSSASMQVEAVILDEWLPPKLGEARVAVVKIDVEGAELRVLKGMRTLLEAHRPALVVEGYDEHLREFGDSLRALREWLAEASYREIRPSDGNLYLVPATR